MNHSASTMVLDEGEQAVIKCLRGLCKHGHGRMEIVVVGHNIDRYYSVGGFNLNINQQDRTAMIDEEEFSFAQRMKAIGVVIYEPKACVLALRSVLFAPETYQQERVKGERF